jgi:predicted porin
MKKKIIAGAVLSVLSGAVFAQSSLTIYGLIDAGVVVERNGVYNGGKTTTKLDGGVNGGSRIGFKGVEDLGGGLSAIFTIESGFTGDTGASGQGGRLFGRQSFVGLTGGFGTVKAGRQYSVMDNTLGAIDPFGNATAGRGGNLVGAFGNAGGGDYQARFDNALQYSTANFGGFTADLQYGFGEQAGNANASRSLGVAVNYANGPLTARLAHQRSNDVAIGATTNLGAAIIASGVTAAQLATQTHNAQHTIFGGTYDLGVAKLHALYAINKRTSGPDSVKSNDALVGATFPFGAHKVLVSYVYKKDKTDGQNKSAQQLGVGYSYDLSKRTSFYAAYAAIKNNNDATYTVGNSSNAGTGSQALNVGLRHAF